MNRISSKDFHARWSKEYELGDNVSAKFEGGNIILTHYVTPGPNTVVLTSEVIETYKLYEEALRKDLRSLMGLGEFADGKDYP